MDGRSLACTVSAVGLNVSRMSSILQGSSLLLPDGRRLAIFARGVSRRLRGLLRLPAAKLPTGPGVYYVGEGSGWVIDDVGASIVQSLHRQYPDVTAMTGSDVAGCVGKVVHFGSLWAFVGGFAHLRRDNRAVVTVFHGRPEDGPQFARGFSMLREALPRLDRIVVSCSRMEQRLLSLGIPDDKLRRIPLGIELADFQPLPTVSRAGERQRLGVPAGHICIGSFQKDGNGWDEGEKPKLVKGPDIFADAVEALATHQPVFVLLTGPARGYVKRRLEMAGIPYRHDILDDPREVARYYACLDLYLMTSREEGGPKSVLEALATGTPLVATRTGMAPDLLTDGFNARLVDVDDVDGIVAAASSLIDNRDRARMMSARGLATAADHDWSVLARRYYEEVYAPLLAQLI